MTDFPRSLLEFQQRFPDEEACAAYLAILRWPAGFVCPACGSSRGWALATKAYTHECADCRKQTSVTAGTVMHGSKLALIAWFWAAYLMATHSNGISALQLQKHSAWGAWLLATKLRRAMVAPAHAAGGPGRSGRLMPAVGAATKASCWSPALSRSEGDPWRGTSPPTRNLTDGWAGYPGASGITHDPHVVGNMAAHKRRCGASEQSYLPQRTPAGRFAPPKAGSKMPDFPRPWRARDDLPMSGRLRLSGLRRRGSLAKPHP